jgi:hypothetical protein
MRDTATPAGVPNKPMMLAAANFTKDRRPAWGGSISASRWAACDDAVRGERQATGYERRKSTNRANGRCSMSNETASAELSQDPEGDRG